MKFKEEKSFFEHLGIADSERVHSEFISWLLSSECNVIGNAEKINFIETLFGLAKTDCIIKTGTEIDNIDIFIETNNSVLIIENKIKSSQHSNQLERYKEFVEAKYPIKKHHFIYLTLVKENSIYNGWIHVSYSEILQELNKLKISESNRHSCFIEDYILYLTKLLSALYEVISHPNDFAYVFKNGSLKKSEKLLLKFQNKKEEFITKNQLETIFQKAFLTTILNNDEIKELNGVLTDTRGTALIDFPLKRNISIGDDKLYSTFIQIQGDNIKFAFAIQEHYKNSKKEWISKIIEIFKSFNNEKTEGYKKINPPKSKAYVSISKKMEKPYWILSTEEIISMIKLEINLGHKLTTELMTKINNTMGNKL
tara:strand:- start:259 stop:1362 length:1104 start_codon:yes stop_codon:yes gene_type:complete